MIFFYIYSFSLIDLIRLGLIYKYKMLKSHKPTVN